MKAEYYNYFVGYRIKNEQIKFSNRKKNMNFKFLLD